MTPRSLVMVVLVALGLALATPRGVQARDLWQGSVPGKGKSGKARDVEYRRQMALGDKHAIDAAEVKASRLAGSPRQPRAYQTIVERAIAAYEAAAKARPDAAEPHYRAAEVIHEHLLESPANTPMIQDRESAARALAHWQAFEKLAPLDPRATAILFRRAIVYTKLADEESFQHAIVDYEALLQRSDLAAGNTDNVATWLGNLAETYMMVGRLGEAMDAYERALQYSNQALYGYGLAVALDRDQQGEKARQVMREHAFGDRLRSLDREGIFFVPEGERHYYLALGFDAMGDMARAIEHYEKFVASGAHPRFQARARENIERLKAARNRRKPEPGPGRGPGELGGPEGIDP